MTYQQWLQHGIDNGYLTGVCLMHNDQSIWTDEEAQEFNDGEDPCILRLVVNNDLEN